VVSVPKSAGAMPYYYNHKLKSGGTPFAFHFGSRYPFGFGLGWSEFSYGEPRWRKAACRSTVR
jgi:beta-glucosidase